MNKKRVILLVSLVSLVGCYAASVAVGNKFILREKSEARVSYGADGRPNQAEIIALQNGNRQRLQEQINAKVATLDNNMFYQHNLSDVVQTMPGDVIVPPGQPNCFVTTIVKVRVVDQKFIDQQGNASDPESESEDELERVGKMEIPAHYQRIKQQKTTTLLEQEEDNQQQDCWARVVAFVFGANDTRLKKQ